MRRFFFTLTALCLSFVSCSVHQMESQDTPAHFEDEVFYATLESYADPETRVYLDENIKILWDADDRISIFDNATQNREFRFTGKTGANAGYFDPVTPAGTSGDPLGFKCAIYPYLTSTSISSSGVLALALPAKQAFKAGSFGSGANTMVSVTEDNLLKFKNVGGYLALKFYGAGVSVSSIKLEGNNGEHLSGLGSLSPAIGEAPEIALSQGAGTSITLSCENPVALGASQEEPTIFWMVVPPTRFTQGFKLTVTASDGSVFIKETSKDLTVPRNGVLRISPIEVSMTQPDLYDIEKSQVREYLAVNDYDNDTDYQKTVIDTYIKSFSMYSPGDRPEPVTLADLDKKAVRVQVSTTTSFDPVVAEVSVSSKTAKIYNLIPGTLYFYRVLNLDGSSIKEGTLMPVGPLRMIYIEGISDNIRDLGGWKAGDKTIRYGRLFRGAKIDGISDEAKNTFLDLGIGLDMEMRGVKSTEQNLPKPLGESIPWVQYKVIKLLGVTESTPGTTSNLYRQALKKVISTLKDDGRAVFFHCEGGADRTGALAFLIEALLGVSESDMSKDFELTSFTVKNKRYRNDKDTSHPYRTMILFLRNNYAGNTMQEIVANWALDNGGNEYSHGDALTLQDIEDLKALLLE